MVDRASLSSAGFGPKSQCVPMSGTAPPRNVVMATLKQYGLALVPYPDVFVITTLAELPRLLARDRWGERIAEALVWGSDRTDRFQTIPRWRREPSPKVVSASGEESAVGIKVPPGWSARRFERHSWPNDDSFVHLIEISSRMMTGWIIVGSCLLAWSWCGRRLARRRFMVLASVLAVCLFGGWLLPSRYASYGAAPLPGRSWLARDRARPRFPATPRGRSRTSAVGKYTGTLHGRRDRERGGAIFLLDRMTVVQAAGEDRAILALFPYQGQFDPTRPAEDVILRLRISPG